MDPIARTATSDAASDSAARSAGTSDTADLVALTRGLVDVDSTTGIEGAAGRWLADHLRSRGWQVQEQPVDATRFNVIATLDPPRAVFSTHFDCVPPFFPSRVEGNRLFGRGSCDAKGILAAQVVAAERLRAAGIRDMGLVFVVGEERGSDGAAAANRLAGTAPFDRCRYLINGEPTDNRLGIATRGMLRVKLTAAGRAAHSSLPHLGESAIDKLLDTLIALRAVPLPADEVLGKTHYTIGLIGGGVAPNVVPPAAFAEAMFRTIGPGRDIREAMRPLERDVAIDDILEVPPVRMLVVDGFDAEVFPYTTDVPLLAAWGQPLLFGPGSITVAHTADEHVAIDDLACAVNDYEQLARRLLDRD